MTPAHTNDPAGSLRAFLRLEGRVAVVTGGAGAIGGAICARLAESGAAVWCFDRPGHEAPAPVRSLGVDLTNPSGIAEAIAAVDAAAGRLDIVVHAAGITRDARLWKTTAEDWNDVFATNLTSAFHLLHASVPVMRRTGPGAIVLISSINGERGKVGQSAYAASKAGLNTLARTAARELGAFGIRVNAIAPGWIVTPMTASVPEEARKRALDESALGRLGDPDDVARAAIVLVTDFGRHITGQVLRVDGGQLIG
jgi:acetoacetyl-CoA reductase/3-oxoacyl-[acyl-carrier protein] reductase